MEKAKCFVCQKEYSLLKMTKNLRLNLPVCSNCKNTEREKRAEKEAIESLGEGFVSGCI